MQAMIAWSFVILQNSKVIMQQKLVSSVSQLFILYLVITCFSECNFSEDFCFLTISYRIFSLLTMLIHREVFVPTYLTKI